MTIQIKTTAKCDEKLPVSKTDKCDECGYTIKVTKDAQKVFKQSGLCQECYWDITEPRDEKHRM